MRSQNSVHAEPLDSVAAGGFEVDVAGTRLDRVSENHVGQPDHRGRYSILLCDRFGSGTLDELDGLKITEIHLRQQRIHIVPERVPGADGLLDGARGRDLEDRRVPGGEPQSSFCMQVRGVTRRDDEMPVLHRDGKDVITSG